MQNYHYDTIRFWVDEFDIDGIRLDAADVLDFDFMRGLRRLANEIKPEFWLMGEVIHGDYSRWANPEMLHSVTNYELHKGLWSGHNDHNYFEIAHTMRRLQGLCHDTRLYTFSDNHDVERLPNKLRNRDIRFGAFRPSIMAQNLALRAKKSGEATGPCAPAWNFPTTKTP